MLLGKFKVSGHSMEPTLKNSQEILVSKAPFIFKTPGIGDVVAFKNGNEFIVKRIKKTGRNEFLVKGDNKTDSKDYGWVNQDRIIGKVIYIFK